MQAGSWVCSLRAMTSWLPAPVRGRAEARARSSVSRRWRPARSNVLSGSAACFSFRSEGARAANCTLRPCYGFRRLENMSRFLQVRFLISAASPGQFPADVGTEVAFAGRSNAGKSSAINAIAQRQGLARTSKTPGRTRLLNFFELGAQRRIVDLPGYGYARAPET